MVVIFATFIVIFCVFVFFGLLAYLINYFNQNCGKYVVALSFDEFYKYYRLNPDSWVIDYCNLVKTKQHSYHNIYCKIKFTSYWRYYLFVWNLEHSQKTKEQKEVYVTLLEEVQKDIDKCKAEAERYNKQGIDMLNDLLTK